MPSPWSIGVKIGVCILIVAGGLSLISTVILLGFIATSVYNNKHRFARSHLATYFICLLICDAVDGLSSVLSFGAVQKGVITEDALCTLQAALKHLGLIGAALWLLVIAIHTFLVLFYHVQPPRWGLISTLCGVWTLILVVMLIGPVFHSFSRDSPPFYGNIGRWCWIRKEYPVARYTLLYFWQLLSAIISFILYTLLFLRLHGNIRVQGWHIYFQRQSVPISPTISPTNTPSKYPHDLNEPDQNSGPIPEPQVRKIARNMMLYPIAYIVLLFPAAIALVIKSTGTEIPKAVELFDATLVWSNGLIDVLLFILTRPSAIAVRTSLPSSLQFFFGRSSEDETRAKQVALHRPSSQRESISSMGQTSVLNIQVSVERQCRYGEEDSCVPPSDECYRPVGS